MGEVTSYTKDAIDVIRAASLVAGAVSGSTIILTKGDGTTIPLVLPAGEVSQQELDQAIANLVDSSPTALDTLNELAAALGDDANFAATVTNSLAAKADLVNGKVPPEQLPPVEVNQQELDQAITTINNSLATKADLVNGKVAPEQLPAVEVSQQELDQAITNVNNSLATKADLVNGKVPEAQLPAGLLSNYVDHGDVAVARDLNADAELQRVRLTGNASLILPAGLTTNKSRRISLLLEQDGTGGRVPSLGGSAPATEVATDSFTAADGTANAGRTTTTGGKVWSGSGYVINNNQLFQNATAGKAILEVGTADQDVTVKVGSISGASFMVVRGNVDLTAGLGLLFQSTVLRVYNLNGYAMLLDINTSVAAGDVIRVTIDQNNVYTLYKNGVVVGTMTSAVGAGNTYVGFAPNSAGSERFDDFSVSRLGAPVNIVDVGGVGLVPKPAANSRTLLELVSGDGGATWYAAKQDPELSKIDTNTQTGTAYTLVLADAGKAVELNNAAAVTLTVPTNAAVAFPIGTVIEIAQIGAGQVTVSPFDANVTIRSVENKRKLFGQYAGGSLRKRATNEWLLVGDLVT